MINMKEVIEDMLEGIEHGEEWMVHIIDELGKHIKSLIVIFFMSIVFLLFFHPLILLGFIIGMFLMWMFGDVWRNWDKE